MRGVAEITVIDSLSGMGSRAASFDFGRQFAAIQSVSIEIEERESALVFDECGSLSNPQPCVRRTLLLGFFVVMDEEDLPFPGSISTGVSMPGTREALQGSGIASGEFTNSSPTAWDLLLDGEGSITLLWNSLSFIPEQRLAFHRERIRRDLQCSDDHRGNANPEALPRTASHGRASRIGTYARA